MSNLVGVIGGVDVDGVWKPESLPVAVPLGLESKLKRLAPQEGDWGGVPAGVSVREPCEPDRCGRFLTGSGC